MDRSESPMNGYMNGFGGPQASATRTANAKSEASNMHHTQGLGQNTFDYEEQHNQTKTQLTVLKNKLSQVVKIARQFQQENEKIHNRNARLKNVLDIKQLELSKRTNHIDQKEQAVRGEFDKILQNHENKIEELEQELRVK